MWTVGIVTALVVALACLTAALLYQRDVSAPVGEGRLFKTEAMSASARYAALTADGTDPDLAVRTLRNDLAIEAVGVIDPSLRVVYSTAHEQVGDEVGAFLGGALADGRFAAQAVELTHPLSIDRVEEWQPGSVVYQVVQPVDPEAGLILSYDISELLARRSQSSALQPLTAQLAIAGLVAAGLSVGLWFARSRARRRIRETQREAEMLAARSRDLERHNKELDAARREAERALELAEETNRIRSEFVLMINHELRTPLTSVVTGAEVLLDQPEMGSADRNELLGHLVEDGRRLVELMSQMLTVARVENRSLQFTLTEIPADQVLQRLAGRWEWLDVAPTTGITVESDRDALIQLIHSLADNARSHGAERVGVTVARDLPFVPDHTVGKEPDDPVYFLIKDDGPGIDHDFLPRAFEKFEKRGRTSGTGLGLYLVRMMAEAIDGYLAVSTSPSGTTMAVGVPSGAAVLEEAR